ncbi:MAG: RtcB family protein [Treponemataceae bacterium]|nr:RtcB family protein [Treponemataceae bacterium]
MTIIETPHVPIYSWATEVDSHTLEQARSLASLKVVYHHVALMPDAHVGFGMPIGGVAAMENAIIPNAVGVDIGCGMRAVKTDRFVPAPDLLKKIAARIRERIPLGFEHRKKPQNWEGFSRLPQSPIITEERDAAPYQLGTLGGGNHFIELQRDVHGFLWVMIHSGSRNFGLKIAEYYHRLARQFCEDHALPLPNRELAYFPFETKEGQEYFGAMQYALEFARENRRQLMEEVLLIIQEIVGDLAVLDSLDVHHNYAAEEIHFGKSVLVHRKGATAARSGERGIIPGSQGSASYIVQGKGKAESFHSSSHGAGRRLGREEARHRLNLAEERRKLENQGIVHSLRSQRDLDEAAGAYKDINQVMDAQKDLVDILVELHPVAVVKG